MAWTTPRTFVTGELETASILNTHLRDNLKYLYGARGSAAMHFAASALSDVLTIAHGLAYTPTFVSAIPQSSSNIFSVVAWGAPTATNVVLRGQAPVALNGDFTVLWQAS